LVASLLLAQQESLIPWSLLRRIVLSALIIMSGTLAVFVREMNLDGCVLGRMWLDVPETDRKE
jgi:hypothetical protein